MFFAKKLIGAAACLTLAAALSPADAQGADGAGGVDAARVAALKAEIVALAESFRGQGDLDFSKQRRLEPLVAALLRANPQPPVRARLDVLAGPWLQVWGPYDYRSADARGVDPSTDPDRIYQVVLREGFYYNVTPRDARDAGPEREIVLLKGAYEVVDADPNMLSARFVEFTKTTVTDVDDALWRLARRASEGALEDQSTIVPKLLVRLFFGGGGLREVYTDDTLRITYGARSLSDRSEEFIYVMTRVE